MESGYRHTRSAPTLRLSPLASAGMQARNFTAGFFSAPPAIAPDFYSSESLFKGVERLCDPSQPVDDELLLNVAVKFFHSYVYEGAHAERVSYGDVAELYENFGRHLSLNEPDDNIELMNRLRQWSSPLRVLADAPRAAHLMRSIIQHPGPERTGRYIGVDIGVCTGVLLLAEHIQACRLGFDARLIWGVQDDPVCGERTHDLVRSLGVGGVLMADPTRPESYAPLSGGEIGLVANETVAGIQLALDRRTFFDRYRAFFEFAGERAKRAAFFPEGLMAFSRAEGVSLYLSRENGFQVGAEHREGTLMAQGLFMDGSILPVHKLGADFYPLLVS